MINIKLTYLSAVSDPNWPITSHETVNLEELLSFNVVLWFVLSDSYRLELSSPWFWETYKVFWEILKRGTCDYSPRKAVIVLFYYKLHHSLNNQVPCWKRIITLFWHLFLLPPSISKIKCKTCLKPKIILSLTFNFCLAPTIQLPNLINDFK